MLFYYILVFQKNYTIFKFKDYVLKFKALKCLEWYNGYYTSKGKRIYNPHSVVFALQDGICKSYWAKTGRRNELADYISTNVAGVKEAIIAMMAGEALDIKLDGFDATSNELDVTKNLILSALTILGYLSYHDMQLRIPNKEIMSEFDNIVTNTYIGGLHEIMMQSREMLRATLEKDVETMAKIIDDVHTEYASYYDFNSVGEVSRL